MGFEPAMYNRPKWKKMKKINYDNITASSAMLKVS